MINLYFILILALFFGLIVFNIWGLKTKPTRYYLSRKFLLYKFFPKKFENVFSFNNTEIELLFNYIITHRCADENSVIKEIRNGYQLAYYPKGVAKNRREWPFEYAVIYDEKLDITLKVGFDTMLILNSQIKHPLDDKRIWHKMYERIGGWKKFESVPNFRNKNEKRKLIKLYTEYTLRCVL